MICFLTSSPCVAERARLNSANGFVEALRKVLPNPCRGLFIAADPDAPDRTDGFGNAMKLAFEDSGFRFSQYLVLDRRNAAQTEELVSDTDLVILAGGHVPTQNRFFQEIGLADVIRTFDGVVLGISAGTMNAARTVYAVPEYPEEVDDPDYQRFLPGLGLTDTMILPHYNENKDEVLAGRHLYREIACPDSMGRVFYALPDGSYLHIENGRETFRGEVWKISGGNMCRMPLGERPVPDSIQVRGARVHNLKDVDVDIPLHKIVGVAGVSGSGKSSLALGVLYAEGSRRYLESLSTYTRRRMTQATRAQVDEVRYVPAALALHQRPGVPGIRSTFGTSTELLNSLRLMFSRLASHRCPNGHYLEPTLDVAAERELVCPICGARFYGPGAEELAFNSGGACAFCEGTGVIRTVDESTLVPDDSLTIDEGAVAPWQSLMWSLMKDIAREMGVRTDVPFRELSDREREIVFHGPAEKKHIFYHNKDTETTAEMDFTYYNAVYTVENALSKVKDEKGMKRVEKFLTQGPCPHCRGTRLSEKARSPRLRGISLAEVCEKPLEELVDWVEGVPGSLPEPMRPMAESIREAFQDTARRLLELGLGYLSLDRAASTLSTGERQRTQLARAVRNRTTGVLYVLDEPSIGLHPSNIEGLTGVMDDLIADGNSVLLVDHDTQVLAHADYIVELGPKAGAGGGYVIARGETGAVTRNPKSMIGPFLSGRETAKGGESVEKGRLFALGAIAMTTTQIHTVRPLSVRFPKGRLSVVTGVSGSGKTTMVLESLIPGLGAHIAGEKLPDHVVVMDAPGILQVKLIDATPIGINVRSTVATYAGVHDELRKIYARLPDAREKGLKAGDFSYNTGSLRCPTCDGTGSVSLDVQFLPDVDIPCPDCRGARYARAAYGVVRTAGDGTAHSLPELMAMSVEEAMEACRDLPLVHARLRVLRDLGLGYLTLGEETPSLSGGEAQRLKLASEMGKGQSDSVFVFDEPTIGLHPLDVRTLLGVFRGLIDHGATVIVIEHDLDVIGSADYLVDMGPGGGERGGRIVCAGTVEEVASCSESLTGRYLVQR